MAELVGVQGDLALFRTGELGVIVDTGSLNPYDPQPLETILASGAWTAPGDASATPPVCYELARAAFETADPSLVASVGPGGSRLVRVPKKVQDAVKAGLEDVRADDTVTVPLTAAAVAETLLSGVVSLDQVTSVHSRLHSRPTAALRSIFGGSIGQDWVDKLCGTEPVTAAAPPPDPADPSTQTDWVDPQQPHVFVILAEGDSTCALCDQPQADPIHVAAAAASNDEDQIEYFATFAPGGDHGPTFKVDSVLAKEPDGSWWVRELGEWTPTQAPSDGADVVQLDSESFKAAASQLDEPGTAYAELSISEERLFELAATELEREFGALDAIFAAVPYIPPEVRSANAKKQLRDAQGHFIVQGGVVQAGGERGTVARVDHTAGTVDVKGQDGQTKTVPANEVTVDRNAGASQSPDTPGPAPAAGAPLARLAAPAAPVADVHALIQQFQEKWKQEGPVTAAAPVPADPSDPLIPPAEAPPAAPQADASGPSDTADDDPVVAAGVTPLYLAEVDPNDTQAVLSCLAVIPAKQAGDDIEVYDREGGQWKLDDADKQKLQSPTPPAIVQLDADMLTNVLGQMDSATPAPADSPDSTDGAPGAVAAAGYALLQRFVADGTGLTASQVQGARLLTPYGGPDTWPQDIVDRLNEFVLGKEASPEDFKNTERLREYWTHGEGGTAKVRWGEPNDWYRCVDHLSKYLGDRAKGYCTLRHHDALGVWPGQEDPKHSAIHASALVGEVQLGVTADAGAMDDYADPDTPHEFNGPGPESDLYDGQCATCGRDIEHPIHVMVVEAAPADGEVDAGEDPADTREGIPEVDPIDAAIPHEFTPGPEGLCECGQAVDAPIHTFTGEPDPSSMPEGYDEGEEFANAHAYSAAAHDECACGRPAKDPFHTFAIVADAAQEVTPGQRFRIPLVVPEGVESGDGRTFAQGSLSARPMPLALMWQPEGDEGHKGSVIVGRIDHVERTEQGLGNAYGVFDTGPHGEEALRLVKAGMLRGISADLDEFEANVLDPGEDEDRVTSTRLAVTSGRLMGITLVAKPAYAECTIELVDGDDTMDGPYVQNTGEAQVAALIAAAAPLHPPVSWFSNPKLDKATHLTVTDDGRVYGHIAAWDVDHIGLPFGTRAPRSLSNYAYFRTGSIRTAEGSDVKVGQLTLTGGHAPLRADARAAVKHYDDTASAVADLAAGEDKHGIWVAGSLRPGVSAEQVRALRASSPSGDWRPIRGSLELVAVCQVNVPGFPVAECMVAGGQVTALVAAGALALEPQTHLTQDAVNARLAALEAAEHRRLEQRARAVRERVTPAFMARNEALAASAARSRERVDVVRNERREALVARVQELKARVAAGGAPAVPFEEEKHPRDPKGRFREVLARLENMLRGNSAAKSGIQRVQDAAGKEDAGDHGGAVAAAREGAQKLQDAAKSATGDVKARLSEAASIVHDAATAHEAGPGGEEPSAGEIIFDQLAEPIKELARESVQRAEEKLDPANPEEQFAKMKAFITGTNPMSTRQVYNFIKNQLKRDVKPHPLPQATGPSPTAPTKIGVQTPQAPGKIG